MKPVIYFVHYSTSPGGIEVLLPAIIKELKENTVRIFVIRPQNENNMGVYKDLSVEIEYGSTSTFIALVKFLKLVVRNNKSIYQLFNTGPFFLFVLRLAGAKKIIYSIHGTIYWKTLLQKFIRKPFWILSNSKRIIFTANSAYSAKVFNEKVLKHAVVKKMFNPIDLARFNSVDRNVNTSDELNIVFVGRLTEGKNLFLWIDIAEYLLQNGIKAAFNIYGDGELYKQIENRITGSKYREKIKLKGHTEAIEQVYKNSDLLLFLSEYESFGNVAVESILCGTPVIAFNIPSMQEIFEDFPVFLIDKDKKAEVEVLNKAKQIAILKSAADKASTGFMTRFGTKQHMDQLSKIYAGLEI